MSAHKRKLPYAFDLDEEDWCEIYYCVGENLYTKIPTDGKGMTDAMQKRLSEKDWIQIYLSIEAKLHSPSTQGDDRIAREWRGHLSALLDTLAIVHETFIGPRKKRPGRRSAA